MESQAGFAACGENGVARGRAAAEAMDAENGEVRSERPRAGKRANGLDEEETVGLLPGWRQALIPRAGAADAQGVSLAGVDGRSPAPLILGVRVHFDMEHGTVGFLESRRAVRAAHSPLHAAAPRAHTSRQID